MQLVEDTNWYYHQYLDRLHDGPSPVPDVIDSEMFLFLEFIVQMGHDIRDRLKVYWSTIELLNIKFKCAPMKIKVN